VISVKNHLVTLNFDCEFGPITFSFSQEKLLAKLSRIVSDLLDQIYRNEPDTLRAIAKDAGLSIEDVKKILDAHFNSQATVSQSAVEKFMQGRNLSLEGSLQQIMDNLPASILLMLIHLTTTTLITTADRSKEPHSQTQFIENEFSQLVYINFKNSIRSLVKGYVNID
jgi:DNA-binding transcriptional MerR regulator